MIGIGTPSSQRRMPRLIFLSSIFRVIEPAAVSLVQEDVAREKIPAASPITSF